MIISDRYRFAFVHIPKCAGTYVRNKLNPFDDTAGYFFRRVDRHPNLGLCDYQHIPLRELQQYFPSEFERISTYSAFAVLRNPFDRFPSSIAQRLREYKGLPFHTLSRVDLQSEVEGTINFLSKQDNIMDATYIYLARQSDYVELGGARVIHNLYSLRHVDVMLRHISLLIGTELLGMDSVSVTNQTDVYRNEGMRRMFEALRPILRGPVLSLLPDSVKKRFRTVLYKPSKQNIPAVFKSTAIRSFVREYYRRDFEIYESIANNREQEGIS